MIMTIHDALASLHPTSKWIIRGDVLEWCDGDIPAPTQSEIDVEIERLQAEYDAQEPIRKRKAEYPSIEECVHAILDGELDALQAKRTAIKAKYPKG